MRYAIFSDVHANETALRAVFADAADARAEKFVCLGDVLGYGPDPAQALELVYRKAHVCLAGNHDDAIAGRFPVEDFTSFAADAVERHRSLLAPKALAWLSHLPYVCEFPASCGAFACAHGDFANPEKFDYILEPRDAVASWQVRNEQLLFVGHTHQPGIFVLGASGEPHALEPGDFVLESGKRYIVNVGSVGYPRIGACRSSYCIYDDETQTVYFRSIPFDVEGYRAKMNGQGLNEAPWVRARVEERSQGEVRAAESFGKKQSEPKKAGVRQNRLKTSAASPVSISSTPVVHRNNIATAFVFAALIFAFAGIWCTVKLVQAVPAKSDLNELQIVAAEPEAERAASDSAPAEVGPVVVRTRCTVPAVSRRIQYRVKMKKGGAPVWVHLRFEDANGAVAGDGIWYQNVKVSKRSPKAGIVAPEGATAVFLEVVKAHAEDTCSVAELFVGPYKGDGKK